MTMAKLRLESITKTFPGMDRPALDNVSFEIASGQCVGLVGGSGSGKSTLANVIMRFLEPDAGDVHLDDSSLSDLDHRHMRDWYRRIQIVFQDHGDSFDPFMRLGSSVIEFSRLTGRDRTEARGRAEELFSQMGLDERIFNARPHQVSGGQRQRVGLARALMCDPDFLICDEITSALDVSAQAEILKVLKETCSTKGVLFITHDLSLVDELCDTVVVMDRGHVVEMGEVQSVLRSPEHPYTKQLMSSVLPFPF